MLYSFDDIKNHGIQRPINGKWQPARPINWKFRTFRQKSREAWLVFIGKADAFVWPEGQ